MIEVFQDYILAARVEGQRHLTDTLMFFAEEFPQSEQKMYYGVATFFLEGQMIVHIGAYKTHLGVCVGVAMVEQLKLKYPEYQYTEFTVKFAYNKALPFDMLEEICTNIKSGAF